MLMRLIRNFSAFNVERLRLFPTLCTARYEIQYKNYKYDVHANMSEDMIKSRIALFCKDSAVLDS